MIEYFQNEKTYSLQCCLLCCEASQKMNDERYAAACGIAYNAYKNDIIYRIYTYVYIQYENGKKNVQD